MNLRDELIAAGLIVPNGKIPKPPSTEPVFRLTDEERRAAARLAEAMHAKFSQETQ